MFNLHRDYLMVAITALVLYLTKSNSSFYIIFVRFAIPYLFKGGFVISQFPFCVVFFGAIIVRRQKE